MESQALLLLFVAATVLLSLGFLRGRRRNQALSNAVFAALGDVVRPEERSFTNIGGVTGYHALLVPSGGAPFGKVEATLTLLPRQSWLYYPLSVLFRRDRLYLALGLSDAHACSFKEGHLLELDDRRAAPVSITRAEDQEREVVTWGGRRFALYHEDPAVKARLDRLRAALPDPGPVHHVALVPEQRRVFVFLTPHPRDLKRVMGIVYGWATGAV